MDFLSEMNRRDEYIKFAHTLSKEMFNMENFIESANALLLHSKLLDWTDDYQEVLEMGDDGIVTVLPRKPAWERKLNLMEMAIDLYDKGKVCICVCTCVFI
jgi:hypothetical protein